MESHYYNRLFAHMAWADNEVLVALQKCHPPDPAWVGLFAHILGAEQVWLARLEDRPSAVPVWPGFSVGECAVQAQRNRDGFDAFLAGLGLQDDQRHIRYVNSAGSEFISTICDILLHVCLHGSYHRGQIAAAMRNGNAAPAPTDYIGFVRGSPAATRQSGTPA
ncbi:MAG: DinB family protein [Gemmatimonadota bacterium]